MKHKRARSVVHLVVQIATYIVRLLQQSHLFGFIRWADDPPNPKPARSVTMRAFLLSGAQKSPQLFFCLVDMQFARFGRERTRDH